MADGGFEYTHTGVYPVWFNVQTLDGSTAAADPGQTVVLADPVDVGSLDPANQAAVDAAALFAEVDDGGPLADRVGSMKVADVLALLDVLDAVELRQVRDAEAAGQARVTLLARIDELLAALAPANEEEVV